MLLVALIVVGSIVALVVVMALIGLALPRDHVATRSAVLGAAPADVWREMVAVSQEPRFQQGITFEIDEDRPPGSGQAGRRVTRIADDKLPFGGRWIYEVAAEGSGSRITITEEGFVKNPVFRLLSATVFKQTATMEKLIRALAAKLGVDVAWR
ncbi:MAG TPA: hypothetical protein VMZ53_12750 [Kofleriaceae bacterium]|nr:hypothetical protein [Kofleriaceae bacterium]